MTALVSFSRIRVGNILRAGRGARERSRSRDVRAATLVDSIRQICLFFRLRFGAFSRRVARISPSARAAATPRQPQRRSVCRRGAEATPSSSTEWRWANTERTATRSASGSSASSESSRRPRHFGISSKRCAQRNLDRRRAWTRCPHVHVPVQVRHELHKLREKAREAADDQKFAVQRTIAGFHQQQNSSLQEFQKCQALRAEKDLELASLKDQEAVQRERAREQRAEMEAEFEAQLAPMREGAPPPLCTALPCVSGAHSRAPSVPVPLARQRTGGLRWPLASDPLQSVPRRPDGEGTGWWARLGRTSTKAARWRAPLESTKARSHFGTASSSDLTRRCFPGSRRIDTPGCGDMESDCL